MLGREGGCITQGKTHFKGILEKNKKINHFIYYLGTRIIQNFFNDKLMIFTHHCANESLEDSRRKLGNLNTFINF